MQIGCCAKSKQPGAAEKALDLLEQMIYLNREGRPEVRPNTVIINCVLDALAKDNAASRAEALLTRMEKQQYSDSCLDRVCLNAISYTSVIG
jgi:hypothetical protein